MRSRRIYLIIICSLMGVIITLIDARIQNKGIALGNVTASSYKENIEWQNIIAADIINQEIILKVNNNTINLKKQKIISDNGEIYIPAYVFRDVFMCAINYYNTSEIVLQKGENVYLFDLKKDYIKKGQEIIRVDRAYIMREGVPYINSIALTAAMDYEYDWDGKNNTLRINSINQSECELPARYNYAEVDRLCKIKNQGAFSTCWAFASLGALETSLRPKENYQFSVDNMVHNNGYDFNADIGGDYTRALAYLTAWRGPVLEKDDIYQDGEINYEADVVKHVQEAQLIPSKNLKEIKKAVFLYGGVESSLYSSINSNDDKSIFYNKKTNSYCYIGTKRPNHDVVIVGWDDNYPRTNFNVNLEGNGAFICMNSWGTDFGENGLFYISYYDSNIGFHNVCYTKVEEVNNYDKIYQSDVCGWVGQLGYETDHAYFANTYMVEEDEELCAVGFYATENDTSYEIYYVNSFIDNNSFEDKEFITAGKFTNEGYYTVEFDKPVNLIQGEKCAVIVRIKSPGAVHPIAIEYRAGRSTQNVDISDGEGYISLTGQSWEHVEKTKSCNICLKMYTKMRNKEGKASK